ncbi:hypothetical protein KY285_007546 [Solanum tuberosum]|nr:hypothetical protein KY285_007546 [Solanum tuberosum]
MSVHRFFQQRCYSRNSPGIYFLHNFTSSDSHNKPSNPSDHYYHHNHGNSRYVHILNSFLPSKPQCVIPHSVSFCRSFSTRDSRIGDISDSAVTQYENTELLISENITESVEESILPVRALISLLDGYHDLTGFPCKVKRAMAHNLKSICRKVNADAELLKAHAHLADKDLLGRWIIIASSAVAMRLTLFPFVILQLHKLKRIGELFPKLCIHPRVELAMASFNHFMFLEVLFFKMKLTQCSQEDDVVVEAWEQQRGLDTPGSNPSYNTWYVPSGSALMGINWETYACDPAKLPLPPPLPPPMSGRSFRDQLKIFFKEKRAAGCPSFFWYFATLTVQNTELLFGMEY